MCAGPTDVATGAIRIKGWRAILPASAVRSSQGPPRALKRQPEAQRRSHASLSGLTRFNLGLCDESPMPSGRQLGNSPVEFASCAPPLLGFDTPTLRRPEGIVNTPGEPVSGRGLFL